MGRGFQKARHKYKLRTCIVCFREYRVYPYRTKKGVITYRGVCCWCGCFDGAKDGRQIGRLDVGHER